MSVTFGWTDIEEIAIALHEAHPGVDPFVVTFPELRKMVEALAGFEPEPDHPVNEQILEAIQVAWQEENEDAADDEDRPGYEPNQPFR
jgi:FeS assembly protein IscX